jgi:hypothetical protein
MFHVNKIILEKQSLKIYDNIYNLMQELKFYIKISKYTMFIGFDTFCSRRNIFNELTYVVIKSVTCN